MLRETESLVVELCGHAEGEKQGEDSGFCREHFRSTVGIQTSSVVDKPNCWDAQESTETSHNRYATRHRIFMVRNLTHIVPPPSRVRLGAPDAEESGDSLCDSLASETGKNIR